MGQVFLGYSPAGRAVAVKVIHPDLAQDPAFRTRFRREVAAARAVSGAYTAPVTAAGPDDDPPWLATVFVPGPSLAEAVAAAGPLPPVSVWKLAAGLVEALQAVHSCGLVHRDLKPANVLLALDGPRVIDFGISRALEKTAMTSTGMIVGTPSYMSPEQAEGARVGPPSDVFSLGCVIVFAATGMGPFGNGPQASMLYRVVHAQPALGEVPGGLRELAAACLAKAPAGRPGLAALVDATAAGRAPDEGDALASFWPAAVTGLIRSHQATLASQMRDTPAAPGAPAGEATRAAAEVPAPTQQGTAGPGATGPGRQAPPAASPEPEMMSGQPVAAAFAGVGDDQPAGPALPADTVLGGVPPGGGGRGVTRRRVFLGLAVVAGAGLASAGWELSRGNPPQRPAAGSHRDRGTKGTSPAPRPSASRAGVPRAGAKLWSFPAGGMVAGIALASGTVFAGSTDGKVYALNASDGRKRWDFPTGGTVGSQITVAGGTVYFGSEDNKVYALRAGDGRRLWDFPTGGTVASAIVVNGGVVYAGSGDDTLYALRVSDGTKLWGATISGVAGIGAAGRAVYAGGADSLHALRASDGARLWDFPTTIAGVTGVAVSGGTVYAGGGDGTLYAVRAADGSRQWGFPAGGSVQSGIAVSGGTVYAGSNNDLVHAVRASDGTERWRFRVDDSVTSGIVVAGRIVYAGSNDYTVRALRASDGSQLWEFTTSGPVESQIAVASGIAYVGSNDGRVYALT
jgi:outer membrane protein assembly factor BamB